MFVALVGLLLQVWPLYLLYTKQYQSRVAGSELYVSINKSKAKVKPRKLFMGDSVGNQLFSNKTWNDSLYSLACNQAIGMAGQYALLHNFYASGNSVDTVLFMYQPFSFRNNLDQLYTFHYFVKPFYTSEYMALWDSQVMNAVEQIPYYWLAQYPGTLTSNWAPDYPPINDEVTTFISPISADYLQKILNLAEEHGSKVVLVPTPISEGRRSKVEKLDKDDVEKFGFAEFFGNYFDSLIYLPDSMFSDGVHLWKPQPYTELYSEKLGF